MHITVLLFGIVADLIGSNSIEIDLNENSTVEDFKNQLNQKFPQLQNYNTFAIAINEEYSLDDTVIKTKDVIAIIPPVSGG